MTQPCITSDSFTGQGYHESCLHSREIETQPPQPGGRRAVSYGNNWRMGCLRLWPLGKIQSDTPSFSKIEQSLTLTWIPDVLLSMTFAYKAQTQTLFSLLPTNVNVLSWLAAFNTGSICKRQVRDPVPSKQATTIWIISSEWAYNYILPEWGHRK